MFISLPASRNLGNQRLRDLLSTRFVGEDYYYVTPSWARKKADVSHFRVPLAFLDYRMGDGEIQVGGEPAITANEIETKSQQGGTKNVDSPQF